MSVTAYLRSCLRSVVTPGGVFVSPSDATVTIDGLDEDTTLTGSSSVPVTKAVAYEVTLSGGAATINLAALVGLTAEEVVDGTGLKVQGVKFKNKATNANSMTVSKGASNGYGLNAAGTTFSVPLSPGQSVLFSLNEAAPDIASGARTWDVAGTGSQVLQIHVLMG